MKKIGIIGLGYVGLPLAYFFDKAGHTVVGLDISEKKISELKQGIDTTNEIGSKISESNIHFTLDSAALKSCDVLIVTVPTPINTQKLPDFTPLKKSSQMIGTILQPGQIIVYESTVYPGCTEEICLPILENISGLSCPQDFQIGYSPERINPGDKKHTVDKIIKVVSGIDTKTCDTLAIMYETIITAGVHKATTIQVAEASKIIENTQRDINIALMNELKKIFDAADINVWDVLEAAGTKWNFLKFHPGLVGGHCIGVDPYRLAYKAQGLGLHPEIILSGRRINDEYPIYIAKQIIKKVMKAGMDPNTIKVLVLGLTFKPNVPDFRNSKVAEMIQELQTYDLKVDAYDPYHTYLNDFGLKTFGLTKESLITEDHKQEYDVLIHAVPHQDFQNIDTTQWSSHTSIIIDIKNI